MSDYPNLDMMIAGCCGPTAEWVRVIPEAKALLAEVERLRAEASKAIAETTDHYAAQLDAMETELIAVRGERDTAFDDADKAEARLAKVIKEVNNQAFLAINLRDDLANLICGVCNAILAAAQPEAKAECKHCGGNAETHFAYGCVDEPAQPEEGK